MLGANGCALLIADHGVPGSIQGKELVSLVHQKWPEVGVILTSGYLLDTHELPPAALFLLKPWTMDELVMAIGAAVQPGVPLRKLAP